MRAVFGLVLILGLGLAGFAVYMVQGYFQQQQLALANERATAAEQVPTIEVYAVNRVVAFGEPLTAADVTMIRYAEPFLPEGVFRTPEELFPQGVGVARYVLRQMEPNEPVLAVKVSEPGQDAGITTRLAIGMRAFAINVDVASGVSGFLRPGDRVDVYWTGAVTVGQGTENVTQLIDSGLQIVAIDQTADDNMTGTAIASTVTVEVSPQQVANLAQAQATGSLSLSLVGHLDESVAQAIEVNQATLLGIRQAAPVIEVAVEPARVCTIRTRRGAEVVEIPIPCTN